MRNFFPASAIMVACLGLTACNDKAAETPTAASASPPSTVTGSAPALAPSDAPPAENTISAWAGDIATAAGTELCALDAVNGAGGQGGKFDATANQPTAFEGWGATTDLRTPANVGVILQGVTSYRAWGTTGVQRDDVAKAYGNNDVAKAGFKIELASLAVPRGDYKLFITHDETSPVVCDTKAVLTVR